MARYNLVLGLLSLTANAQQAKPSLNAQTALNGPKLVGHGPIRRPAYSRMFTSAKDIADRIAAANAAVAAGKNYDGEPLLMQNGYRVTMEWRNTAQNGIHAHLTDAEMFVIIEGTGTLTLGGTLVNPHVTPEGPYEGPTMSADTVEGAKEYKVSKGDMIMIPENTPHAVTAVDGKLVLWSMILPHQTTIRDIPPTTPGAPVMPSTPPVR